MATLYTNRVLTSQMAMVRDVCSTVYSGATGYSIYRSIYDPGKDRTLGLPLTEVTAEQVSFEDRLNLKPVRYWYSVVALDANGTEGRDYATVATDTAFVVSK